MIMNHIVLDGTEHSMKSHLKRLGISFRRKRKYTTPYITHNGKKHVTGWGSEADASLYQATKLLKNILQTIQNKTLKHNRCMKATFSNYNWGKNM